MNKKNTVISAASFMVALGFSASCLAQAAPATNGAPAFRPELIYQPRGNYSNNVARPLRYWPVGTDFVITNGAEFFNRPLYSMNSGFRIDGGDKPEFSLYLPGRGGNLRLGIKTAAGVKWLNDARQIVTRYRPGSLLYAIHDPLLGDGELDLAVLPLADTKGFIVRAELRGRGGGFIYGLRRRERRARLARRRHRLRAPAGFGIFPDAAGAMPQQCVFHRGQHVHAPR